MYLKNANWIKAKSWSIVNKLIIFYSLSTIGLVAAVFLFLYPTFNKLFYEHKVHSFSSAQTVSNQLSYVKERQLSIECFKKSILALLLSALFAILFGNIIARNGLKRIKEFTILMEKITAKDLHERLNLDVWPKELISLGRTFNTMLDRIEKSFIQLSQFSSDLAHELRSPINNLRLMTEIALAKKELTDSHKNILESYLEEYEYLTILIENLLFLARSDYGQTIIDKKPLSVRHEILKICEFYSAIADEKNIEFVCEGDDVIEADSVLFKRVINNVISNALQYAYPHSILRVQIQPTDETVQIMIRDNGIGIDIQHLPKIIDRFYRVDSSRSTQSGGLGLGLSIVKSIMDLHQGQISIESQLSVGTSVYLYFPR